MTVRDFLYGILPQEILHSDIFIQMIELLEHSNYLELLVRDDKLMPLTTENPIINDIVSVLIKNKIYLCSDYVDYQQYLLIICLSSKEKAVSFLISITQQYIKEKRIEELKTLSFILYMLSDFVRLSPLVCLIDKYFYKRRIVTHQNIWDVKIKKEMDILIKLAEPLHQYSFIDSVFKHHSEAKNVKELATLCGHSYSTFKRLFCEHFHTSPYKWMLKQRKEQVMYLIQFSKFLPFEIADRCNFSSASNFNSFCKKYLGDTPGNLITRFRQF
jgi:AraC-like DNA-binding protein